MDIYTATATLILVMDPLGNIPYFLSELKHVDKKRHARIIFRESCIAFFVLTVFLFFGSTIMKSMDIGISALRIAGGIILFLISLRMIFPPAEIVITDRKFVEPFIVPLAVPLTAGPSAIATVMLFASQAPGKLLNAFLALVVAFIIFIPIVLSSGFLMRVLGERGLIAIERLMGMLLTTLAVQMFLQGLSQYFHLP